MNLHHSPRRLLGRSLSAKNKRSQDHYPMLRSLLCLPPSTAAVVPPVRRDCQNHQLGSHGMQQILRPSPPCGLNVSDEKISGWRARRPAGLRGQHHQVGASVGLPVVAIFLVRLPSEASTGF
jgi:hypothetical protein